MPQTEKRKIIRIGKTSLCVILPKAWLRYFSLQAGDKVEVITDWHITIKPPAKTANTNTSAEVSV